MKFWSKNEILVKNQNFGQKSKIFSKIVILAINRNLVIFSRLNSGVYGKLFPTLVEETVEDNDDIVTTDDIVTNEEIVHEEEVVHEEDIQEETQNDQEVGPLTNDAPNSKRN